MLAARALKGGLELWRGIKKQESRKFFSQILVFQTKLLFFKFENRIAFESLRANGWLADDPKNDNSSDARKPFINWGSCEWHHWSYRIVCIFTTL